MAETPEGTSSPIVIPTLTKTDARELKSLVSRDTKILLEELEFRAEAYSNQLHEQLRREVKAIEDETRERQAADQVALNREMAKIQRRINAVNASIRTTLDELEAAGWHTPGQEGIINKGRWEVALNQHNNIVPPASDFSDLEARSRAAYEVYGVADQALTAAYNEARRSVAGREADVLRDLTLQSITTEAAREFILEMPSSDDLLPAPAGLVALPGPVSGVEFD